MFDIGFWELLVVALIGLIILGPERLPRAVRSLQETLSKVRQFGSKMEAEINHELRVKELHDNLRKIESADDLDNLPDELKKTMEELQRAAASVNRPYAKDSSASETSATEAPTESSEPPATTDQPKPQRPTQGETKEPRNDPE
ncbi:MAG: Sec-independent protein translocase subunit TatB [Idiomarina sp.]|nr:Sec-independent protein translocase subunit TatB [Idiomarina sp.]